jgi:cytochrome c2
VIAPDSSIWLTEHMARGGDELNLLREGADYGFPHVSYGTSYGTLDWPIGDAPGRHEGFMRPVHAWVPSIGPSQMVIASGKAFPAWRGDILLATLPARSLYRIRVEEGRVIFVEPMPTIHRMRDLIETAGGEFVILAEDGFLVYLSPIDTEGEDPMLIPRERGQIVASRCQGCHTFNDGGANGIGPNLFGIVGRRIASQPGFAYSDALRGLEGRWTEETLGRFIAQPAAVAPGTSMEVGFDLSDRQREDLFTYLRSLR